MTWKCPVCAYENADDSLFCIKCGTKKLEEAVAPQQPAQPQVSSQQPESIQQPTTQQSQVEISQQLQVESQPSPSPQAPAQSPTPELSTQPSVQQPQVAVPQPSKYYLLFINTPNSAFNKTKLPLDFDIFPSISLGRSPENVIVIPDPEVSRKHAVLSLENGELYIEDLNSTNGTYIYDGKMFQPIKGKVKIQSNSIIKLGNNTVVRIVGE
ncbi:hypothetical protein DJ528_02235 [Sulfolobus sp. B5]|nr:hypothetical protein DJ528_02235 [Sulfolobus sp. B5]